MVSHRYGPGEEGEGDAEEVKSQHRLVLLPLHADHVIAAPLTVLTGERDLRTLRYWYFVSRMKYCLSSEARLGQG